MGLSCKKNWITTIHRICFVNFYSKFVKSNWTFSQVCPPFNQFQIKLLDDKLLWNWDFWWKSSFYLLPHDDLIDDHLLFEFRWIFNQPPWWHYFLDRVFRAGLLMNFQTIFMSKCLGKDGVSSEGFWKMSKQSDLARLLSNIFSTSNLFLVSRLMPIFIKEPILVIWPLLVIFLN